MSYPEGFARRFLEYMDTNTGVLVEFGGQGGWITYPADGEDGDLPLGGRVRVTDDQLRLAYDDIADSGIHFYPEAGRERAAMLLLATSIYEILATTDGPQSPEFTIREIIER